MVSPNVGYASPPLDLRELERIKVDETFVNEDTLVDVVPVAETDTDMGEDEVTNPSEERCQVCKKPIEQANKCCIVPCGHVSPDVCLACGQQAKATTGKCPLPGCGKKIMMVCPIQPTH